MTSVQQDFKFLLDTLGQAVEIIGGQYADGLFDSQYQWQIVKDNVSESISNSRSTGVCLRKYQDGQWGYESSDNLSPTHILEMARRIKDFNPYVSRPIKLMKDLPYLTLDKEIQVKIDPRSKSSEEKLARIRELHRLASSYDPRIVNVRVVYRQQLMERIMATSTGSRLRQVIPRTRFFIFCTAKEGNVTDQDYLTLGGTKGYEIVENLPEEKIKGTVDSALEQLKAQSPPKGNLPVILDPSMVGITCHESFGHGLEADQVLRNRSYLSALKGKSVASPLVTIYEDSIVDGGHGTYFFDDDGVPARKNVIVEKGILVGFLHDIMTASALNENLTANSRAEGTRYRRFPRMTNTYAGVGEMSSEELIKDTKYAVMLVHASHGMEDPLGGGMQIGSNKGYIIENGEKKQPLKSITLSGRVLDVLRDVDAVSNDDFHLGLGMCGKGNEDFVPESSGGSTWRTKGIVG
jgi:TldD protein